MKLHKLISDGLAVILKVLNLLNPNHLNQRKSKLVLNFIGYKIELNVPNYLKHDMRTILIQTL